MAERLVKKIGFYSLFEKKVGTKSKYTVDNGKTIYSKKYKKYFINPNRDVKEFNSLEDAKNYVSKKLKAHNKTKDKIVKTLPKSLYLILLKEEQTGNIFVKVGITSKRFIMRRFSKNYGYEGYKIETILRRIDTPDAENLETQIKEVLKKKKIAKYRPILENFSGYSECFSITKVEEITKIFDSLTKNV